MSSSSISTKKHVSSGAATHRMGQQSLVAASLPLLVNLSPTCNVCTPKKYPAHNHLIPAPCEIARRGLGDRKSERVAVEAGRNNAIHSNMQIQ